MTDAPQNPKDTLLDAVLSHVPFDGWSDGALLAAAEDVGMDPSLAKSYFPRGGVDMALAFHRRGDAAMVDRLKSEDLSALRFRDRIAAAVRSRLEAINDKDLVRRGTTLFALPTYAGDGAKAVWDTADQIWTALGDTSEDINWYTKRATLSGVYGATVLYWLGDDSPDHERTWAFLDRRIDDVMQIEKAKAQFRDNPLLKTLFAGPNWALSQVKAPTRSPRTDLPGSFAGHRQE